MAQGVQETTKALGHSNITSLVVGSMREQRNLSGVFVLRFPV